MQFWPESFGAMLVCIYPFCWTRPFAQTGSKWQMQSTFLVNTLIGIIWDLSYCQMAIDKNEGLPLQNTLFPLMPALRQSLQRTKVLIDTSTPYQIGEKSTILAKNGTFLKNSIWRTKIKDVINVCMHKFACTNVTLKRRNGAHFTTHALYCAWVITLYSPSIVHYITIHSTWYTRYGRRSSKLYWAFLKIPTK